MTLSKKQRWAALIAAMLFVGAMVAVAPQQAADFVRALGIAFQEKPQ